MLIVALAVQLCTPPLRAQSSLPASTTQIPTANPAPSDSLSQESWSGDPLVTYQKNQNSYQGILPNAGSLDEFMNGADEISPLGLTVTEDSRRLKSGQQTSGLLVIEVDSGSPAAVAGLKAQHHALKHSLEAVAVAGAFIVPPAAPLILLVPMMEASHLGESYDLIIGVDGFRTTTVLDLQDCMRDVMPGEVAYLSLVHNGARIQLPVPIPAVVHASR